MMQMDSEGDGLGGSSDSKPDFGVGKTMPTIKIGEPNAGRNYPAAIDSVNKSNAVGGMPMGSSSIGNNTDPKSVYK